MVDFRNGINAKTFEYKDNDGIVQKLLLRPLKGDDLQGLFRVMGKLQLASNEDGTMSSAKVLELLGNDTGGLLHFLCVKTLKVSYPEAEEIDLELFVSSHLMELFPIVIELNIPKK